MATQIATERLYRLAAGGRVELACCPGDDIPEGAGDLMTLDAATAARTRLVARGGQAPAEVAQAEADAAARATGDTADAQAEAKAVTEPDEHKARPAPARLPRKPPKRTKPKGRR